MRHTLKHLLRTADTALLEMGLALFTFLFGAWIVSPFWDSFTAARSFEIMSRIAADPKMSELLWGSLMTGAGLLNGWAVLRKSRRCRTIAQGLAAFAWFYVGTSFLISNFISTGTPLFLAFSLLYFYLLIWRSR